MIHDSLYSSRSEEWGTPQALFDKLNAKYHFDLDVCASKENAKCEHYFTKEQDGLAQKWWGTVWCNPPYGREIRKWVEACVNYEGLSVMLVPARVDTKWFHDCIYNNPRCEIEFPRGRLRYNDGKVPAPFPSMIVVTKKKGA